MKKVLSILLSIVMVLAVIPIATEKAYAGGGPEFNYDNTILNFDAEKVIKIVSNEWDDIVNNPTAEFKGQYYSGDSTNNTLLLGFRDIEYYEYAVVRNSAKNTFSFRIVSYDNADSGHTNPIIGVEYVTISFGNGGYISLETVEDSESDHYFEWTFNNVNIAFNLIGNNNYIDQTNVFSSVSYTTSEQLFGDDLVAFKKEKARRETVVMNVKGDCSFEGTSPLIVQGQKLILQSDEKNSSLKLGSDDLLVFYGIYVLGPNYDSPVETETTDLVVDNLNVDIDTKIMGVYITGDLIVKGSGRINVTSTGTGYVEGNKRNNITLEMILDPNTYSTQISANISNQNDSSNSTMIDTYNKKRLIKELFEYCVSENESKWEFSGDDKYIQAMFFMYSTEVITGIAKAESPSCIDAEDAYISSGGTQEDIVYGYWGEHDGCLHLTDRFVSLSEANANILKGVTDPELIHATDVVYVTKPGATVTVGAPSVKYPEVWEPYYETLALKIAAQAELEAEKMLKDADLTKEEPVVEEPVVEEEPFELIAKSERMIAPDGKDSVKVTWTDKNGKELDFDGYEIFRSNALDGEYVCMFDTTNEWYYNTLIKKGEKYYYKVRGYKIVDGEKVYSEFSTLAYRTVK